MNDLKADAMGNNGNDGVKKGNEGTAGRGAKGTHSITGVKRVLIADDVLDGLGELQQKTKPRLDMRYLVEGAIRAATQANAHEEIVQLAREQLRKELDT
jgi:hypothetical protein